MTQTNAKPLPLRLRSWAVVCALSVWVLGVLGSSTDLHGSLHRDAADAGHTCAITLFSHGVEQPVAGNDPVVAPVEFSFVVKQGGSAIAIARVDHRLPPGCGPPSA